jgi:hypothetical protein
MIATYPTSATLDGAASQSKLEGEIRGSGLPAALAYIDVADSVISLHFLASLSESDQTTLDAIVAAHKGLTPLTVFRGSITIQDGEVVVADVTDWQEIGAKPAAPFSIVPDVSLIQGRCVAIVKTTGAGSKLRIVEKVGGTDYVQSAEYAVPNTGGTWVPIAFASNADPHNGLNVYRVEGKVGAAETFSIKGVLLTLLEELPL